MFPARGFTLIELMITLAVMAFLLFLGVPSFATWLQNTQIRTSAESVLNGLQVARNQAVQRNSAVRFYLVDPLDSTCARSSSGKSWVVSLADPSGACDQAESDTAAPQIIQKKSGAEGTSASIAVAATAADGTAGTLVTFDGLGRVVTNGDATQSMAVVNVVSLGAGTRPMRVLVGINGVRMCDPAVNIATDPRGCP